MKSIPCGLFLAFFVQVALSAPSTDRTTTEPDTVMMGQTVSFGDLDQFVVVFGVSPCMASCMRDMHGDFNSTDKHDDEEDNPAKFQKLCDNYLVAAECFQKCPDGDDHIFDVIASGANFMCVEQRAAFERAMPCIRENKKAMKEECGKKCKVPEDESDMKKGGSHLKEDDSSDDIPPQWNNSSSLFAHVGDLCEILHCSIECGRDLLNERCEKDQHVGNLITEVIIRPLEKNAEFIREMSPELDQAINQALPKQCHYILDKNELNALRAGWVAPHVQGNDVTEATSHFVRVRPAKLTNQRRRRSASNLIASSGVFASNAFSYFV